MVIISCKQGPSSYEVLNTHLAAVTGPFPRLVAYGDAVGIVGQTGTTAAPHLHFQVKKVFPERALRAGKLRFININPYAELHRLSRPERGARRLAGPLT
jgi:hypothetical protein